MCARNEQNMHQNGNKLSKSQEDEGKSARRTCYAGARKISLTCYNRTFIDAVLAKSQSMNNTSTSNTNIAVHQLEAKRKTGCRLRSPVPSPCAISPSSSPNRSSRFQVFRVSEPSPIVASSNSFSAIISTSTPSPVSSVPSIKSDAEIGIGGSKALFISPRSRFQVRRIYEDPKVPLVQRALPPITPPINLPPTPLSKNMPTNETDLIANSSAKAIVVHELDKRENMSYASVLKQEDITFSVPSGKTVEFSKVTTTIQPKLTDISKEQQQFQRDQTDASETSSSPTSISSSSSSHSSSSSNSSVFPPSALPPSSEEIKKIITSSQDVHIDDNEATLTGSNSNYIKAIVDEHANVETVDQSTRKTSWIANPTTVDKLLNIFQNPAAFFQRSISPEPKDSSVTAPASVQVFNSHDACNIMSTFPVHKSTQWQTETFPISPTVGDCKQQSPLSSSSTSPVPWCSNSTEIAKSLATTTTTTTAAAATLVQSRSFLDNASRQFKDLSKQVFGTNFPLTIDQKSSATSSDDLTTDLGQPKIVIVDESALDDNDNV